MTNGSSSCDGTRNNLLFNACNNACAEGSNEVEIDGLTYQCYQALDCFNNGGEYIPETGFCKTGTCSNTGEDCNGTCPPAMVDGIPTPQACVATEGNCHDQPLCNEELSLCFDPSPSADTPKECNDATKSKCTAKGNCRTDSCE
jgi:hypothetical protein